MAIVKRWPAAEGVDELFVARYSQLVGWAQKLLGPDPTAAEDLVHDTFVRVALRHPDPREIRDLDAYLFVTMRNVQLSQVRRRSVRPLEVQSLADYESLEASLLAVRAQQNRQAAYEELTEIARYACLRKATSKGASALILRFFHGYYPTEIARILHATEPAVDARLRIARAEARAFVAEPDRVRAIADRGRFARLFDASAGDLDCVVALRRAIFDACTDDCLSEPDLDRLYAGPSSDPLKAVTLAHVVSCASCLDAINRRFGLALLKDRDPSDMLGRGGRRGPPPAGPGVNADRRTVLRTRLKDVLDDRPKELRIAVNGLFVGSQAVTGGVSEQRVRILINERIGFIEVFGEHDTCLMYVDVVPPPDGPAEQRGHVDLSDDRQLALTLTFRDVAPLVEVTYRDPTVHSVLRPRDGRILSNPPEAAARAAPHWWRRLWQWIPGRRLATAGIALALVTWALWIWSAPRAPTVTAGAVLQSARVVEARPVPKGMASHRVMTVEERVGPSKAVVRRQRVEIWRDGTRGIKARRLYDERSRVIAGQWTTREGLRTTYRTGQQPTVEPVAAASAPLTSRDIWTRDLSADAFAGLVGASDRAVVEERDAEYLLRYRPDLPADRGVIEATLTISKADQHATAETLILREDGELHEFTLSETQLEEMPVENTPPSVFEPDPTLWTESLKTPAPAPLSPPASAPVVLPVAPRPPLDTGELDKLELDAIHRLYRSHVWLGQNAHVSRTAFGIAVTASVPDELDRAGLERGFEELLRNRAVTLSVDIGSTGVASLFVGPGSISAAPAYPMLQSFFGVAPSDTSRDEAIGSFAHSIVEVVARRQTRLAALQTLINRWPEDRLRGLPLESVVTWQVMVQEHADRVRRDTELLRVQLGAIFKRSPVPVRRSGVSPSLSTVAEAAAASAEVVALAADQDASVRAAFLPCQLPACTIADVETLLQSFAALEGVASRFAQFYLRVGREPGENRQWR